MNPTDRGGVRWAHLSHTSRPLVGSMSVSPRERAGHVITALEQEPRELGYIEGENVQFEHRFAGGDIERLPALAEELVRLKVDVIVVAPNPSIVAAKRATSTIPIVTTYASDPVAAAFAASLARLGGNVTGLTADVTPETWGIRLQLLRRGQSEDGRFRSRYSFGRTRSLSRCVKGAARLPSNIRIQTGGAARRS